MIPLLVGLGVLIGGAILVACWGDIVKWLEDFIPKLKKVWEENIRQFVPHAAAIFGDMLFESGEKLCRIMHKLFYKEKGEWIEETTTRKVNENEVPAHIRERIKAQEADITREMEEELALEIN